MQGFIAKFGAYCSAFFRRYIWTRENLWVLIVSLMLLLILVLGTMGVQPHFVYGGY
jgi:hypothetical protein